MPAFVQFLAGIFLVLPGAAMWIVGLLALFGHTFTAPGMILHGPGGDLPGIAHVYLSGISILLLIFGYAMIASFDLLTTKRRYNIPAKNVVPCIGMELLVQILGVACFAVTVSSLLAFWNLAGGPPWLAALLFLAGFAGCTAAIWIHKGNLARRERWRIEHAASLPQHS